MTVAPAPLRTKLYRPPRCVNCPLRTPTVGYSGPADAKFVIIGESPGAMEVGKGRPFVGDSGKVLRNSIPKSIDQEQVLFFNAQKCLPPKDKDKALLAECARSCRADLLAFLSEHPRELIMAVGNAALWSLTGNYDYKITQERGKIFPSLLAKQGILAVYHPSYVLRGGGSYKVFRDDVHYAASLVAGNMAKIPLQYTYRVLGRREEDLSHLWACLDKSRDVGSDVETTGFNPRLDQIMDFGFGFKDQAEVCIIPREHLPYYSAVFDREDITFIWHNGKFDSSFFRNAGVKARVDEDTMLLSYALNEMGGIHGLDELAKTLLGAPDYKHKVDPYVKSKDRGFQDVPKPILYQYRLAPDCGYTLESWRILRDRVRKDPKLEKLYTRLLLPASAMLQEVEARGFYVDKERLEANEIYYQGGVDPATGETVEGQLEIYAAKIQTHAEAYGIYDLNPNSPKQLIPLLFDKIKLKNKRGLRSTGEDVLKLCEPKHPIIEDLLKYREVAKAYGTYVKGIRKHIEPDGCVHSTYKLIATRTGRLSSSEPNVQNIPRDSRLKGTFVARPGFGLLDVDLDQAELRCLAALSGDPALCHIYETEGLSLHKEVSKSLWDNWEERYAIYENDPDDPVGLKALQEYFRTKAVNFGIVYGREAPSIADDMNMPLAEAQYMIDAWFEKFPVAKQFIDNCRQAPVRGRSLVTPFGRKKRFGAVSWGTIHELQNQAANFPHQSCASDITLYTAIKVYRALQALGVYIVNLVHDSIVTECPPDKVERARLIIEPAMRQTPIEWGITRIPFKTESKLGDRWGYGKKLPELVLA